MSRDGVSRKRAARWLLGLVLLCLAGCAAPRPAPFSVTWVIGRESLPFDPQGPPDAVRWALERLLARGLVDEDSLGQIEPASAESVRVSADSLVYSFVLREGLAYADGSPCVSADFRRAIEQGVARIDHGTYAWLLGSLTGMDRLRPGKPLPALGLATPDDRTLVMRLGRADPLLLRKLALPGVATPWRAPGAGNEWRDGVGPYRIAASFPGHLVLARREASDAPDTIHVRFMPGVGRQRAMLRSGVADLVWPAAPGLVDETEGGAYEALSREAQPSRHLLLVMRADLPPTARPAARQALAHGLNRGDLIASLGRNGRETSEWLPGGPPFDFPAHDPEQVQQWLDRGKLGRSLHVVMAYSAEGVAAQVARSMQGEWARLGLDVELRPLSASRLAGEALKFGGAQLVLIEDQPLLDDPRADLAALVAPVRGPAIGSFRTGWATREFDRWILGPERVLDVAFAQQRLAEEDIVLPLARLPWSWIQRRGIEVPAHPRYGPDLGGLHRSQTKQRVRG